jgi:predicted DNA binding CopG/RHH family protein
MKTDNKIYTADELEIVQHIENGNYTPLDKSEFKLEKKRLQMMAMNTLKRKSIPIEIIEQDIPKIEAMAFSEGMSYQLFIASILHKLAIGELKYGESFK